MMDKAFLVALRADMGKALKAIEDKHDVKIEFGRGTFDSMNATLKVTISTKNADGVVVTPEARNMESVGSYYGFSKDDVGAQFRYKHRTYTITGLSPQRPKFPINAVREDGRAFKFPAALVRTLLTALHGPR